MKLLVTPDSPSLAAALALRSHAGAEGGQGEEIVVATVGDDRTEDALRRALAVGAERAVRVWDPALGAGPQPADGERADGVLDALVVASALAALARAERPDVIVCAAQDAELEDDVTGVALAGLLDLAHVAHVASVERDGDELLVHRELDGGAVELLRVSAPVLLTVHAAAAAARQPTLRELKRARAKPLTTLSPSDLDVSADELEAACGARTVRLVEDARGGARPLEGEPEAIAGRIAEIVREAMRA